MLLQINIVLMFSFFIGEFIISGWVLAEFVHQTLSPAMSACSSEANRMGN